ncbi:MAG: serine/threonine protein kinase [Myxococcota bacterium]
MTTQKLGKYTLVKKLATGGMAEVFLARADGPMGFSKKCVVKRILPHFNDDPRFIEMFLGEARLAAELNHPNLVQIFDFGQANGQYFIAMEYIDGANVRVLNQATRAMFGPMDFALAARLVYLAAEGLHFAHELRDEQGQFLNLVHRDISPDNILVARNGSVKVVDFGIAKASSQPHLTKSGMIKGKMAYMPPEQLAREALDRRADLFALGIVLYELITGGMPFDATSEVSIIQAIMSQQPLERAVTYRPDCPPGLEAIVQKCLQKDREKRYQSCRELQADLDQFIHSTGKAVGTREIAQLVETVFAHEADATTPNVVASDVLDEGLALDRTLPSAKSQERPAEPAPTAAAEDPGLSRTAMKAVAPSRTPLFIAGGLVALALVGGGAWWALRPPPHVEPLPDPKPAVPVAALDAGQPAVPPPEVVDAAVALEPEDAGAAETPVDAGAPTHAAIRYGKLELRIRPYATVYLDEKLLGDTPLPAQSVPLGRHKLRLVNSSLGKDVVLDVVIKPGENVVKHNLKE